MSLAMHLYTIQCSPDKSNQSKADPHSPEMHLTGNSSQYGEDLIIQPCALVTSKGLSGMVLNGMHDGVSRDH